MDLDNIIHVASDLNSRRRLFHLGDGADRSTAPVGQHGASLKKACQRLKEEVFVLSEVVDRASCS